MRSVIREKLAARRSRATELREQLRDEEVAIRVLEELEKEIEQGSEADAIRPAVAPPTPAIEVPKIERTKRPYRRKHPYVPKPRPPSPLYITRISEPVETAS